MTDRPHRFTALAQTAQRLKTLLDEEFVVLKNQELDAFEALQSEKIQLIKSLSEVFQTAGATPDPDPEQLAQHLNTTRDELAVVIDTMRECKQLHQRNELFILRKLDAIKGALATLRSESQGGQLELYDKLGKTKAGRRSSITKSQA